VWPLRHPLDREIFRLAIPALGALIAEPAYVLTDTAIVGRLGTPQLAGLAVASAVLLSLHALMIFLAYGTTGTVARRLGAGDHRGAAAEAVQGLWLAVGVGVVVAAAALIAAGPLVRAFGAAPEVEPYALTYLRISLLGFPSLLIVLAGTGYLRGLQDTRTPLVVAVSTALGNLVLELVLVFPLDLGVAGSAWSTVAAQTAAAIVYGRVVLRAATAHGVTLWPDPARLRAGAALALSLIVRTAALRGAFVLATLVAAHIGTEQLAAHEVGFQVWAFLALALDALAIAAQAMVGHDLGAGDVDRTREATTRLTQLGVMAGLAFTVAVAAAVPFLPRLFSTDPAVVDQIRLVLWFVAGMQVVNAVVFVLDGVLIGAQDLTYLAGAMVVSAVVFAAGAAAVLAADLGLAALWTVITAFLVARLVTLGLRVIGSAWLVVGAERRVRSA
jgi:MATE family, multidrug efflux pump